MLISHLFKQNVHALQDHTMAAEDHIPTIENTLAPRCHLACHSATKMGALKSKMDDLENWSQ